MTPHMTGALIGFVLGFAGFVALRIAASRIEKQDNVPNAKKAATILRMAALADWLLLIVIGFFIGPMIVSK
jgi:hypothetical protein